MIFSPISLSPIKFPPSLSLSLALIINHYSRCGFGKGSLFWHMHHLTPQFTPQSTPLLGSFHLDSPQLSHSVVGIWKHTKGLGSVNTHKSLLGKLGQLVRNTVCVCVCVCNSSTNASRMLSSEHSLHTKSLVMQNALWWILGKNAVFWDDLSEAELLLWLGFSQPSIIFSNIQIKPDTLTAEQRSA